MSNHYDVSVLSAMCGTRGSPSADPRRLPGLPDGELPTATIVGESDSAEKGSFIQ